jgi:F0F1-type ATP synthase gamma subunit
MKTIKVVIKETGEVLELRGVVESYEEIAAMRMQKIRADIINSREYFDGLSQLSKEVGVDYNLVYPEDTTSSAAIYISANAGLYGDIVEKTFFLFLDYLKKNKVTPFVIGKRGAELMRDYCPAVSYYKFELSDDKIEEDKFRQLITQILKYKNIIVFYGRFKNVVNQSPAQTIISGELLKSTELETEEKKKRLKFLYEPSLLEISKVMGNEILASIFEAMVRESQLAKYASRLMYLDSSIDKIDDELQIFSREKRKIKKRLADRKQRLVVTGVISRGFVKSL